jgi:preprotein translocase subunit SecG
MFWVFTILIVLASFLLGLIVLIQNPKGGGLSGSFGGVGNQLMGVKQTTDVLEKGTWLFAAIVGLLCIFSPMFLKTTPEDAVKKLDTGSSKSAPTAPKAGTPAKP